MSDWISSIKMLDDGQVVVMTAHSIVALLEIVAGQLVIKFKIKCEESSTLYCSHINGTRWDDLIFFGGTALGELIIWKRQDASSLILQRQFLHNGVIFCIDYDGKYLLTSSDDRSIKVFEVNVFKNSYELIEKRQLFGHTARVFVTRVIKFDNKIIFLSAGEDSNVCVWSEAGELLSKTNIASSGGVWNLDYDEDSETLVTCSSTGTLNKLILNEILSEKHWQESLPNKFFPAKVKYLENGTLVVLDSNMELFTKFNKNWIKVAQPPMSMKFFAMEVHKSRLFLVGKCSIVIYDYSDVIKSLAFADELDIVQLMPTGIKLNYLRAIHALSFNEVCVSDVNGLCLVIELKQRKVLNCLQVPKSYEPWTTSAAKVSNYWLIADRVGNLFVYENNQNPNELLTPIQKLWKLHGHLGITTIILDNDGFINTTGNDGTVKKLWLDESKNPPKIDVHRSEKTSVNWIANVHKRNEKEFLLGFNDNYFTIYHNRQIIYEHRCGGRHRQWDVYFHETGSKVNFSYIQRKQLNSVEFKLSDYDYNVGEIRWHTKPCNAILAHGGFLISGGEDTLIKISSIRSLDGELSLHELATVNSHVSSIKAFSVSQDQDDVLIFSAGGRAQIAITRLINMKHIKEEVNYMLTNSAQNGNAKDSTLDPETRFTSIHFDEKSRNLFVACSDGFVRAFKLANDVNSFVLKLITEHFYGKCVLKIHVLEHFVLTMATDGFICFWQHDETKRRLTLLNKLKHNQSGINCFDILQCGPKAFLIGTSGDDAGIFITEFCIDDEKIHFNETISSYEVHTAQVTGLKFITRYSVCTTSVDQTICLLKLSQHNIEVVKRKFTCVSDVKGFEFLENNLVAVYGAGLEVLTDFT